MGGWDYHCFLCAAGFHNYEVADDDEIDDGEVDGSDQENESGDEDNESNDDDESKSRKTRSLNARRAKKLFSKRTVEDRTQWLSNFRTIGQNRNATGLTQCYLSGLATEDEYGSAEIVRGDHPNAQNLDDLRVSCYNGDEDENGGDLPVHDKCFALLCEVFSQAQGIDYTWIPNETYTKFPFELDALFACLADARGDYESHLNLDHRLEPEQYFAMEWCNIYDYFDPLEDPEIPLPTAGTLDTGSPAIVSEDSSSCLFETFPNEMLSYVLDWTAQKDLVPLMTASKAIRRITKPNKFWQSRLRRDAPWLWEYRDTMDTSSIDWQAYYNAVMMQVHKPLEVAEKGTHLSGLANRSRIWHVCEQVLQMYLKNNSLQQQEGPSSCFEEGVLCHYLPVVASKDDENFKIDTAFFFTTKNEMRSPKQLKLKWAESGALCGISLTIGDRAANFGDMASDGTESVLEIQADDWIEKLVLNISAIKSWTTQEFYGEKHHERLAVTGITVHQLFHETTVFGKDDGHKRILVPREGCGIVGLKCQFSAGKITHLGILEHPEGLTNHQPERISDSMLDLLWADLPPVNLSIAPYASGYWMGQAGWDLVPMRMLLFGSTDAEQSTMVGFGASSDLRRMEIYRSDGTCEGIGLHKGPMKVFPIDGPGGERIAGYETAVGALPTGLTLVTTKGRQVAFGKRTDNGTQNGTSAPGLGIAGIYCSFNYGSATENCLSSLGMVLSQDYNQPPMDGNPAEDNNGLLWEPQPPPSSWHEFGNVYGSENNGEVAVCIDFSRPIKKIEGLFPAPEWLSMIEIGGFTVSYADDNSLEPLSHFGFAPQQWPTAESATSQDLQKMARHVGMAMTGGKSDDSGKAHVETNEEALKQPTTWDLEEKGEKIVAVTVWASDYLYGLQFHSESGKDSPRWGKCGKRPSGTIHAGGRKNIVGLKVILGSQRLNMHAGTMSPQAVQAMSDAPQRA